MKSRPLADRVIIKPDEPKKQEDNIWIPEEKLPIGKVLSVGIKVQEVEVGDKVMYGKFSGVEIMWQGQECLIVHEKEVMCFL